MSSEQPRRGRDSTGSVGSPMGSTAAIVIAVVAVVAGFLILRQIRDDDDGASGVVDTGVTTTAAATDTTEAPVTVATTAAPAAPTTVAIVTEGAKVVVANASRVDGAAGVFTTALNGEGFDMAQATNAGGSEAKLDVSKVYYDPTNAQALPVASSIAALMGNVEVAEIISPPPTGDGVLPEGVTVLVMLGSDKAAKTLAQMAAGDTAVETTVAGETTTTVAP